MDWLPYKVAYQQSTVPLCQRDDAVLWHFPKLPFLIVPVTPVTCHYFYEFDKKSSSYMIDFTDRYHRIDRL
ncbi:hypothetical protein D3F97_23840 [Escherichia coli]|nr:hypothetical protein [Escherichia coli]EEY5013539.1 hypothetical protein [Escherichia coli]EFN9397506.1 hypothetical protein [Escherichia coli]PJG72573.1 hypothetical protein CVO79_21090 [Escherichia coli]TXW18813.1 hypothetical protein D4M59_19920 [Escherichia coli]